MKKLTAGIFATILGVTAMGAADAAVTSKGYVDTAVGAVAQSVTALGTTVSNTYATKQALETAEGALQDNIDAVALVANAAATKAEVGTPDEGKTVVGMIKDVEAKAYDDTAVRGLIKDNADAIDVIEAEQLTQNQNITDLQNNKANTADLKPVATTGSYNSLTDLPTLGTAAAANIGDFATAGQGAKADTAVQPGALAPVATSGAYSDLDGKPDLTVYETKSNAETTYELKANVSGAAEGTTTGKYVLTKIDDGQGNVSFGWELIDRDYVSTEVTPDGQ